MAKVAYGTTPPRLDHVLWSQAEDGNIAPLAAVVAQARGKPAEQVVAETIIVENTNPLAVIHPKDGDCYDVRTVGGVSVMRVQDERGAFVVSAWPTGFEGVFHLIGSIPATDPRWDKVNRWIGRAAPQAVRCFLDHDDFTAIGTALSEHDQVEVQRVTGRMIADRSSWSRGFPVRAGSDVRPDHHEEVREAEASGVSVRTLHLHVGDVMDVLLRRIAGATFYRGDFAVFEDRVLGRLAVAASRRRALLSGRERRVNQPPKLPIEIGLASGIFTDATATAEVIRALEATRDVSYSVLHRNPYLHVVVTDNSDGSNYDLFVTRADVIELHPGFRASLGSFTRIAQELGAYFEAAELRERPTREPVSVFDLIAG